MPKRITRKSSAPPAPTLRGRVWIETGGKPALTDAGADLLDQIIACGSLSGAARRLRYSYRRAWMLIDAMNRRWPRPVVRTATGGKHGGGAQVTEFGRALLRAYRDVQIQVEHVLGRAQSGLTRELRQKH